MSRRNKGGAKQADERDYDITYPPNVKPISASLNTEELYTRLKNCCKQLSELSQDVTNILYQPLAWHLSEPAFLSHKDRKVQLLTACALADILRIFAPDEPFQDAIRIRTILNQFIVIISRIKDTNNPSFDRYFYLLEAVSQVKTFNIVWSLDEKSSQDVIENLFDMVFKTYSSEHSNKVRSYFLDLLQHMIVESDSVSQPVLDIILQQLLLAAGDASRSLAADLVRRTAGVLASCINTMFDQIAFGLQEHTDEAGSVLTQDQMYECIIELYDISPGVLTTTLPQLEIKLKVPELKERLRVFKVLSTIFCKKDSNLAEENKPLWKCFLGRFRDISAMVRKEMTSFAARCLIAHPELLPDLEPELVGRNVDPDESVRLELASTIVTVAKRNLYAINANILGLLVQRSRDTKWKVRSEACLGLGLIYKRSQHNPVAPSTPEHTELLEAVNNVKNQLLGLYRCENNDDRILIERIFCTSLVPYSLGEVERMERLLAFQSALDECASKCLNQIFQIQSRVRYHLQALLRFLGNAEGSQANHQVKTCVQSLAGFFPEANRAQEHLKKLYVQLQSDKQMSKNLDVLVSPQCTCKMAENAIRAVCVRIGDGLNPTPYYELIRTLLERVAPLMLDVESMTTLVRLVHSQIKPNGSQPEEHSRGVVEHIQFIHRLASANPHIFLHRDTFVTLTVWLVSSDLLVSRTTLRIFASIAAVVGRVMDAGTVGLLFPRLQSKLLGSDDKASKYAVQCFVKLCSTKGEEILERIYMGLKDKLDYNNPNLLAHLSAVGHIAYYVPLKVHNMKSLVTNSCVKGILMKDRRTNPPVIAEGELVKWVEKGDLDIEYKAKIRSMKLLVLWLLGLKDGTHVNLMPTFRLLTTLIVNHGDLMETGLVAPWEAAHLRMAAGKQLLRLAGEPCYESHLHPLQWCKLAYLVTDDYLQVRTQIQSRLYRLLTFQPYLPLRYIALFAYAVFDRNPTRVDTCKRIIERMFALRRAQLRLQAATTADEMAELLPDYVVPHLVYLLAHDGQLDDPLTSADRLILLRKCVALILDPLIAADTFNFSFLMKMVDNIKHCKDVNDPDSEVDNAKLYAVCDLVSHHVQLKSSQHSSIEYTGDPMLPKYLYTPVDRKRSNNALYLPQSIIDQFTEELRKSKKLPEGGLLPAKTASSPVLNTDRKSSKKLVFSKKPSTKQLSKSASTSSQTSNTEPKKSVALKSPRQSTSADVTTARKPESKRIRSGATKPPSPIKVTVVPETQPDVKPADQKKTTRLNKDRDITLVIGDKNKVERAKKSSTPKVEKPAKTKLGKSKATVEQPTAIDKEPTAVDKEPTAVDKEPTAIDKEPTAIDKEPTAVVKKPTAVVKKPTAVVKKPTAVVKKQTAVVKKPTAVVKKPTAVIEKPSSSKGEEISRSQVEKLPKSPSTRKTARSIRTESMSPAESNSSKSKRLANRRKYPSPPPLPSQESVTTVTAESDSGVSGTPSDRVNSRSRLLGKTMSPGKENKLGSSDRVTSLTPEIIPPSPETRSRRRTLPVCKPQDFLNEMGAIDIAKNSKVDGIVSRVSKSSETVKTLDVRRNKRQLDWADNRSPESTEVGSLQTRRSPRKHKLEEDVLDSSVDMLPKKQANLRESKIAEASSSKPIASVRRLRKR